MSHSKTIKRTNSKIFFWSATKNIKWCKNSLSTAPKKVKIQWLRYAYVSIFVCMDVYVCSHQYFPLHHTFVDGTSEEGKKKQPQDACGSWMIGPPIHYQSNRLHNKFSFLHDRARARGGDGVIAHLTHHFSLFHSPHSGHFSSTFSTKRRQGA